MTAEHASVDDLMAMQDAHAREEAAKLAAPDGSAPGHRNGCTGCAHDPAVYPSCWSNEQVDADQASMRPPTRRR